MYRLITLLSREIRGLHEAAYLLAAFTLAAQVLALVRDRTFAHLFGAGPTLDAYFAAFRIPDLVFALLTLFVSSFALVPLLSGRTREEQGAVIGPVLLAFGVTAVAVTAVLFVTLPTLMPYLIPGFSPTAQMDTIVLSRIMLLQPLLLGLSSIAASVLQASRRFMLFALAPIFYNGGIIVGAALLYPSFGIVGLAWGVVLGAALHLGVQVWPLLVGEGRLVLSFGNVWRQMRAVVLPSVPRAAALMANQGALVAFVGIASAVSVGAVSALSFGFNLQSVPLSIIGVSYAAALFPALAAAQRAGDQAGFARELWATVRHVAFWLLPATALFIILRAHLVRVVLGSGAFSWDDTRLTAAVLALFVVSLLPQALMLIFSRAYYALGRTWLPIVINVSAAICAALAAILLVAMVAEHPLSRYFVESLLRVGDIPGTAVLMIPLAYTAVMSIAALAFAICTARAVGRGEGVMSSLGISFSASVIGAAATYVALQAFGPLLPTNTFLGIFAQGAGAGTIGLLSWVLVLSLMRSREFGDVVTLMRGKLGR